MQGNILAQSKTIITAAENEINAASDSKHRSPCTKTRTPSSIIKEGSTIFPVEHLQFTVAMKLSQNVPMRSRPYPV